jgi:hypothetical protein
MRTKTCHILILALFFGYAGNLQSQINQNLEPEFVNSAIYVDGQNAKKLEKAIPFQLDRRTIGSYVGGVNGDVSFMQIKGTTSTVRLPQSQKYSFIVRVNSNDFDPLEAIAIVKMVSSRENRIIKVGSTDVLGQQKSGDLTYVSYDGKKYGQSSYLLTINNELEPGEYAIQLRSASDVLNCFGVGEPNATSNLSAQNEGTKSKTAYSSASQAHVKGDFILNGGLGFGSALYGGVSVFLGGEYMINDDISIGLEYVHMSYSEDMGSYYYGTNYTIDYKITTFGPRISYHAMRLLDIANPKLDLYGGLFLGYAGVKAETSYGTYDDDESPLAYSLYIGANYMVTERFGFMGELGYGVSALKLGVVFKL